MRPLSLIFHPTTPFVAICRFEVNLSKMDGGLLLEYQVEGVIENIHLPDQAPSTHTDGLWQTTCFEAFIQLGSQSLGYYEFNFSPSSAWAAYRFDEYRAGMTIVPLAKPPNIFLRQTMNRLESAVLLDLESLPLYTESTECLLALSAVIEDKLGNRSYWALAHPSGKPDFHHRDSFAFKLDSSFF